MAEKLTMNRLADLIPTEADAYAFLEGMRWKGTPVCPHCSSTDCVFLNPENGRRRTRTGSLTQRRVWQCRTCRKQFSVLTGTVMHGTKISVRTWVFVMFEVASNKNGIAAREVERRYGLAPKSAWHLLHRIREAMGNNGPAEMMTGTVIADETYIGGAMMKMNTKTRARFDEPQPIVPGVNLRQGPGAGKSMVLSLISAETGEVRSKVVPDVTGATLRKVIAQQVDMARTTLYTDEAKSYRTFAAEMAAHETVNHHAEQYARYVDGKVITTNRAESFFAQLKRSIDGTHHHISREHLHRYLAHWDFLHSTRKMTDTERMARMIDQTDGIRLSYRPLVDA